MSLDHLEICWILGSLAIGFGLFVGVPVALVPVAKRPLAMATLGVVILCVSSALSGLIYRDSHAHEMTQGTAHPQGLEWAGIDQWAHYAGYVIGGVVMAIGIIWWVGRQVRLRHANLASVTSFPEQPFQAAS